MRCPGYLWLLCTVILASLCWDKAMSVEACRLGECVLSWDAWHMVLSEIPLQKNTRGILLHLWRQQQLSFFCVDLCYFCTFMMSVETLLPITALMWFLHEIVNKVLTVCCERHWEIAIRWFVNILVTFFFFCHVLPCECFFSFKGSGVGKNRKLHFLCFQWCNAVVVATPRFLICHDSGSVGWGLSSSCSSSFLLSCDNVTLTICKWSQILDFTMCYLNKQNFAAVKNVFLL